MREQRECPVCGSTQLDLVHEFTLRDTFAEPERVYAKSNDYHRNWLLFEKILGRQTAELHVSFLLCGTCGLIFFTPRPDEDDLTVKYADIIVTGDSLEREAVRQVVDLRQQRAEAIRHVLEPHLLNVCGRALDIGGADGHALGALTDRFECGILDYEKRALWPGVTRLGATLDDLGDDDRFALVMTNHTLEHIPNVIAFLRSIYNHLAEDGIVYIEVPDGAAGEAKVTRNLLTHINFFSTGSLAYALELVGLTVEDATRTAVLSRNRYLPVVRVIARKAGHHGVPDGRRALASTRAAMAAPIDRAVTAANAKLVASHPLAYLFAFASRWRR